MRRLNAKWGNSGNCIRLQQRQGNPEALSDLIFATQGTTYSIEVKRITSNIKTKKKDRRFRAKTRPLSFGFDFSKTTRDIEFQHQLERQVKLCERMGWIPLVLLQVVSPSVGTEEYLFDAISLYEMMKAGEKSLNSSDFKTYHQEELHHHLLGINKAA